MPMKNFLSKFFTFALLAGSIYSFYEYSFLLAVILLIWTLSRLFGYNLQRLIKGIDEINNYSQLEKKCNVILEIKLVIEEILNSPAVSELFDRLKENEIIKNKNRKDWITNLVENYKKKFDKENPLEEIRFNIKNNVLWKNGEIDFNDSVYHEIFIPYEYKNGKEEEEKSLFTPDINIGLSIRVFIVNGILKLQIGNFSKELSSEVIKKGLDVYKTYETITSFPLMYFHWQYKIPENYLNLSMYATDSYYQNLIKETKGDFTKDWKEINEDVRDYNYVCSIADQYVDDSSRWEKIIKRFDEKKNLILKENNFKDPFARDDDDDYYDDYRSNNVYYLNNFMSVFIANYNDNKEKREKYAYTDYYEERP